MAKYGVTFAAIGLAFTGIDCAAETFRGTLPACQSQLYRTVFVHAFGYKLQSCKTAQML